MRATKASRRARGRSVAVACAGTALALAAVLPPLLGIRVHRPARAQPPARDIAVMLLTPRPGPKTPGPPDHAFATLAASASESIVVAAYGLERPMVVAALVEAQARLATPGAVRVVEHVPTAVPGASGGDAPVNPLATAGISVTKRTGTTLMHDKFAVFDQRVVWTGSANFTDGGFGGRYENVVLITSTVLADAYRAEFAHMHDRRFASAKPTRSPVRIDTDAGAVHAAFSPKGGAETLIVERIRAARASIDVAAHELTRPQLAQPLATAAAGGVRVRVLYDDGHLGSASTAAKRLLCNAGAMVVEEKSTGTLHHKYAVIDPPGTPARTVLRDEPTDPVVLTGSANWTQNGMTRNDENVLAIHSPEVAAAYARDFAALLTGPIANLCPTATRTPAATATPATSPAPLASPTATAAASASPHPSGTAATTTATVTARTQTTPTASPTVEPAGEPASLRLFLPALEHSPAIPPAYPYP